MNFGELSDLLLYYLHRTDMTDKIPGFVELARSRLSKDCRFMGMQEYIEVPFTEESSPLPADFLEVKSLTVPVARGGYRPLQFHTNDNFGRVSHAVVSGAPQFFTLRAGSLVISPFNGSVEVPTVVSMNYFQRPAKLVNPEDTNSILEEYPELYLHASLIYAHKAVQDHESEQVTHQQYGVELRSAKESEIYGQSGSPTMLGV